MKRLIAAVCICILVPTAASAYTDCFGSPCGSDNNYIGSGTTYVHNTYGCGVVGGSCDSDPSFATIHKWVVAYPGTLTLSGTSFAIVFDPEKVEYRLQWGAKQIGSSPSLGDVERLGVQRAQDMQDAGMPLK
jgi:hypothetical protein